MQARPVRSRLAKSSRLGDGGEKAAVANALGLSPADKMSSLGGKMGSLSVGKGALAAKLPLMSLGASARTTQQANRTSPRRQGVQAVSRQPPFLCLQKYPLFALQMPVS